MNDTQTQVVELDNIVHIVNSSNNEKTNADLKIVRMEEAFKVGYRVAYKLLGNREASEDVAIEEISRVLDKNLQDETYANSYVARVAARLVVSAWRKDAVVKKYAPLLNAEVQTFESAYKNSDMRLDVCRAIAKLTKRQREMVVLRYLADMSEAQVADVLHCSIGTVKSTTHDALEKMKMMVEVKP